MALLAHFHNEAMQQVACEREVAGDVFNVFNSDPGHKYEASPTLQQGALVESSLVLVRLLLSAMMVSNSA